MNFGQIIEGVNKGKKAQRKGWNGKGMYIFDFHHSVLKLSEDEEFDQKLYDLTEIENVLEIGATDENTFKLENFILLKTAIGTCIPWNASQSDMLANDWELID